MHIIILSVILLGLTHPLGSIMIKKFDNFLIFAILYILIRTLFQAFLLKKKDLKDFLRKDLLLLLGFSGFVGGSLNYFQFKSLSTSVPLNEIILITFCFPVWIMIYETIREKGRFLKDGPKVLAALTGLALIFGGSLSSMELSIDYLYPFLSSICIACWVIVSKMARSSGLSTIGYSFGYDFFSLIALSVLYTLLNPQTLTLPGIYSQVTLELVLYSVGIGVLPNLLFYFGIKKVSSVSASVVMLAQPVLSILFSSLFLGEKISATSMLGLSLIILANLPKGLFSSIQIQIKKVPVLLSNSLGR